MNLIWKVNPFNIVKLRHSEKTTKLCTVDKTKEGGDFAKFCGLLRIYELYKTRARVIYDFSST